MTSWRTDIFLSQWRFSSSWVTDILNRLSDKELETQLVRPRGPSGMWVLGHLVETEDRLSIFLNKEERYYPELMDTYITGEPPADPHDCPSGQWLRRAWEKVAAKSERCIQQMSDEEWDADNPFLMDENPPNIAPELNRQFNPRHRIVTAWMLHQTYHVGQLNLIAATVERQRHAELR